MNIIKEWEIPGLDDVRRVTELQDHKQLIISPTLNQFHPWRLTLHGRKNPPKEKLPVPVANVLAKVDFRNLPETKGLLPWQIYFSISGPEYDDNPMELRAPAAFLCAAFGPDGHELTQRELIDVGDAIAMDVDVSFVRVDTTLLTPARMQMIADQCLLPNGEQGTGIVVRSEERPTVALRLRNHNYNRKETNE